MKERTEAHDNGEEQSRRDHLEQLIADFERRQTIQDVGTWLIHTPLDPLPPKHIEVLREWLEENNELTIKQSRRGNPHSYIRNAFVYVSCLSRDTGMSVEAACKLVLERLNLKTSLATFRRQYDRAQTGR